MRKNHIWIGLLLLSFNCIISCYGEVSLMHNFDYAATSDSSIWETLIDRATDKPFYFIATLIFLFAIIHTFMAGKFMAYSRKLEAKHRAHIIVRGRTADKKAYDDAKDDVSFLATLMHFLGEVEVVFAIWLIPLILSATLFYDWHAIVDYINKDVVYTEAVFVVVIMSIASSRPVINFAERCLETVASLGKKTPQAWWLSILIIAPLIGSFITEPAAITLAAILLSKQFYQLDPPKALKYGTLGLLFVNISVGGSLTHFAAPPVLIVAGTWNWDFHFMLTHFGWKAIIGILFSTLAYYIYFRKDFKVLRQNALIMYRSQEGPLSSRCKKEPIPIWITTVHILFLVWTVFTAHYTPFFIAGYLFFLAFVQATGHYQDVVQLRTPLLVGLFLAGLVTHGGLQRWWIEPVLSNFSELTLFIGSTILTTVNDNASITYLSSLVSKFSNNVDLQYAVVAGALTGGGLTVIANAPNPAGQSLLMKHFKNGISPLYLFLGALFPTIVMGVVFYFLDTL